jgi:hypothetical protein
METFTVEAALSIRCTHVITCQRFIVNLVSDYISLLTNVIGCMHTIYITTYLESILSYQCVIQLYYVFATLQLHDHV